MLVFVELFFVSMFVCTCEAAEPPKFHLDISPKERLHYFGTDVSEEVPDYEYTTPQPVDKRKKRSASDDTLEYLVEVFGETTHLILEKNRDLVTSACVVQHMNSNGTRLVYPCAETEVDCFYTGRIGNHSDSWVSATVCGGLHGMIGLPEKTVTIQPIREKHKLRVRRDTELADPHIVYIRERKAFVDAEEIRPAIKESRSRRRRSDSKKYIETAVVVDPTVYDFHGDDTERMVKTVMNIAAERFLDPSLGTRLYMILNKLVILEENQVGLRIVEDSTETLNSFCDWQAGWNPVQDSNPEHADYVLLITKLDLEHNGNKANTGLARGGMCGQKTKCSVNEDSGLGTGVTITHETGHVLGLNHDSAGNDCEDNRYVMSASSAGGPDSWKWSRCSADKLKEFLKNSECLDDAPPASADKLYEAKSKPGTIYSATKQCKLYMGKDAEVCEGVHANGLDGCGSLVCRPKPDVGVTGCIIPPTPLMDGTDCGDRKWCLKGQCVAMGPGSPEPIDGKWSEWESKFSQCSRSCGGGVKVKRRFCNNPEPMYGGKPCSGPEMLAELCNVKDCVTSQYHFKAEQCAATDNVPLNGHSYHWVPSDSAIGDDSCKTLCEAEQTLFFLKRGISHDGTDCPLRETAPYSKCVFGKCKPFGCDGHMDSNHVYDKCAICNGKGNTCTKKHGTFHGGEAKVFNTFVTIPAGSTGITITEKNAYCYLSLDVGGEKLFTEDTPRRSDTYNRKGVIIKYQTTPEKIEIVGPIKVPVKAQVYRQYGPRYVGVDPDVYYEYHVPSTSPQDKNLYLWKTKAGTCSKTCGTGTQVPTITCENSGSGTVPDYNCDINQKPAEIPQSCNTHPCPPRWRTSSWSTCSKSCGGGQKHRTVECVQETNNVETVLQESRCHGQTKPITTTTCNTEACPGFWKAGSWSKCSETCGRGLRTRDVKCYRSSSSNEVLDDSKCIGGNKPATQDYCLLKPCRTDISGSECFDKVSHCFSSYGEGVCTGQYKAWARGNCMKSCGVCVDNPADYDDNCKDEVSNCDVYQTGFCTDSSYVAWAKGHCKKFCGYCETEVTQAPPPAQDCVDTDDCAAYGETVCTGYPAWSKTHCKRFCNLCGSDSNPDCTDASRDCAAYDNVCVEYEAWSKTNCKKFCGFCDSRRKRDVLNIPPPLKGYNSHIAPPLKDLYPKLNPTLFTNSVSSKPRVKVQNQNPPNYNTARDDDPNDIPADLDPRLTGNNVMDIESKVDDVEDKRKHLNYIIQAARELAMSDVSNIPAPPKLVCNTVLTDPSGEIDIIGELAPAVECEHTIAVPVKFKVEVNFTKLQLDCERGDQLILIDGVTNEETHVCDQLPVKRWISSANIAVIRFVAASEGQGYGASYRSVPSDDYIPACSRVVTSASGEVSSAKYPTFTSKYPDDSCEFFIVGTPGKNIQIVFNTFITQGEVNHCNRNDSVVIVDMESGEEDMFCGELRPFIWESRGSRVRLVYSVGNVFTGKYSVVDI